MIEKKVLLNKLDRGEAILRAVKMGSEKIVSLIKDSELRGRGGAGFPTGIKWERVLNQSEKERYLICNADEGEPGTFKDRILLEEYTERMIEGMIIGQIAIGAKKSFIYLRQEYKFLAEKIKNTIEEYKKLFGDKVDFQIDLRFGAGAYVCGEEFALIESLNGFRGEPRNKPPFPTEKGFKNKPTVVNNVETLCNIPHIVLNGASWFKKFGVKGCYGTKLFSVAGDVEKPGIYEVEMGIPLIELLEHVGGVDSKAVQVGGYAGTTVVPEDYYKTLCFGDLPPGGSIIVIGKNRDMGKVLENILEFFLEESCGQCTPCREGNYRLLEGLRLLRDGKASIKYLKTLFTLCDVMKISAKCGLGQSSPNSFLAIMKNFKDEILYNER